MTLSTITFILAVSVVNTEWEKHVGKTGTRTSGEIVAIARKMEKSDSQ